MSSTVLRQVTILDPLSPYHRQTKDVLVEDGLIRHVADRLPEGDEDIAPEGAFLSPGWLDMRVNFRDPGEEHKEDLFTGAEAAAYGGMTAVLLMPDTSPALSTKAQIEYILSRNKGSVVDMLPAGSIFREGEKDQLSDLHDLRRNGAVAFTSGTRAVEDEAFLQRAMLYCAHAGAPLILNLRPPRLGARGLMHEGEANVRLGMKGVPTIAEEMEMYKIVILSRYTGCRVHVSGISSVGALRMLQAAHIEGLPITGEAYGHHLTFTDDDLMGFDTNLKLRPPVRRHEDREALRAALLEGLLSTAASDHQPHENDSKEVEFELAEYGASGVQTLFSQLLMNLGEENLEKIVEMLSYKGRQLLRLPHPSIREGEMANLTLFHPNEEWTLDARTNQSRSRNNPFWGRTLQGRALWIYNKGIGKYLTLSK